MSQGSIAAGEAEVQHRYSVANWAWTNGMVERKMWEITRASKAILNERGRRLSELTVLQSVQWAVNTEARQRFGTSYFHVMLGREPRTSFVALEKNEVELAELDEGKPREH